MRIHGVIGSGKQLEDAEGGGHLRSRCSLYWRGGFWTWRRKQRIFPWKI